MLSSLSASSSFPRSAYAPTKATSLLPLSLTPLVSTLPTTLPPYLPHKPHGRVVEALEEEEEEEVAAEG